MKIQERAVLHNRFDIKVVDAVSGKIKQTAACFNITDLGGFQNEDTRTSCSSQPF